MNIFVCFPLTHKDNDKTIVSHRIETARKYCLELVLRGHVPFCPGVFGIDIVAADPEVDISYGAWEEVCETYIKPCHSFHILMLDGWKESKGVRSEIKKAEAFKVPTYFIERI